MTGPNRGLAFAWAITEFLRRHTEDCAQERFYLADIAYKMQDSGCVGVMLIDQRLDGAYRRVLEDVVSETPTCDLYAGNPVSFAAYDPERRVTSSDRTYRKLERSVR